ncbi:hypothetical protein CW732_11335 [Olleya sp. Bg11-27]|nr:hypothetical protein CW732_11335 [Olleya sp. Bg11-27]
MEAFFKANYLSLTFGVELFAVVTGLFFYRKFKNTVVKYFIWFLVFLIMCEIFSTYTYLIKNDGILSFLKGTKLEKNYWFSTLTWSIGSILFFSFYYYKIIKSLVLKAIIKYSSFWFFCFSCIYIIVHFDDFFIRYFPIITVLGAIIIVMCVVFYFIEILNSNAVLNFYKLIHFYISGALLIWWLIITPLVFYDLYFNTLDWDFIILKWQIYLTANFFMYLTFALGFIISRPNDLN